MDSEKPTPEQVAKAALASLNKSVSRVKRTSADDRQRLNSTSDDSTQSSSASTKLMDRLWLLMTGMYGHKWTSVQGTSDELGIWGKCLHDINGRQIAQGMHFCATRQGDQAAWPPSAPEFREMCLSTVSGLGIPTVERAWKEACEASYDVTVWKFTHPIVQEAGRLTDWYSIKTGTPKAETVQKRFEKRYNDLTQKLQRGEQLVDSQYLIGVDAQQGLLDKSDAIAEKELAARMEEQGVKRMTPQETLKALREKMRVDR